MSSKLLLPHQFKIIGWCLLIPATIVGVFLSFSDFSSLPLNAKVFAFFSDRILGENRTFSFIEVDITNTVVGLLFIAGAMLVGFSREKREDEFIANLRLSSLLWAVWVSYAILFLSFLFIWGTYFLTVMIYNMFTVLIIFIIRFNYVLYRSSKTADDEK